MKWITNEFLFYGGITIAVAAVMAAIVFLCISRISKHRLDAKLKEEYGDPDPGK